MHRLIIAGLNGQQIAAKDIALLHTQIFFNPEGGCFLKPRVGKLCDQPWDSEPIPKVARRLANPGLEARTPLVFKNQKLG